MMSAPPPGTHEPLEPWNRVALPDLYRRFSETGLIRRLLELARDEDLGPRGST
jgi:hypothetical protein